MENALDQKLDLSALHLGSISLGTLLGALLTLVICLVSVRLITALLRRVLARTHIDARVQKYLVRTVQLVLWVVTVLITADQLGIPVTSLVAQQGLADAQLRRRLPLGNALLLPQQAQRAGKISCHSLSPIFFYTVSRLYRALYKK